MNTHIREIAFDTETTGLDPAFGHRIIELGGVELINKVVTGNRFQRYVNPLRDVPKEAYQIHGISGQFLKDKPLFKDIVPDLLKFIGNSRLIIHNAQFDINFLNHEFNIAKIPSLDLSSCVDTLLMAKRMFPTGVRLNLDSLCNRFKIDNSGRQFHGALKDALLLAEVYIELCGGRQSNFNLTPKISSKQNINNDIKKTFTVKTPIITPTEEELAKHKEFMHKFSTN